MLTVWRSIERNPVRARLVTRAEDWRWSSFSSRGLWLHGGPVTRPPGWTQWVNTAFTDDEVAAIRQSVNRGTPCGWTAWKRRTAKRLGLEASMTPRGRPRKIP